MRLILGIGPGRCGTASLATLLGRQPEVTAVHTCPVHPIHLGEVPRTLDDLRALRTDARPIIAAVGPQWLEAMPQAMDLCPKTRVVLLQRPLPAILASMERTDYWRHIRGLQWCMGASAPDYVARYYIRAHQLGERYPERFRAVDYATPSWPDAAGELLAWLGIEAVDLRPVVENATRGRCQCA